MKGVNGFGKRHVSTRWSAQVPEFYRRLAPRCVLGSTSNPNNRALRPQRTTSDFENNTCDLWEASWIMYILE
jgi:hypothetical protein